MQIKFPYRFDDRGRTAATSTEDHLRDMIEQVLFTSPGERINRPEFGCGLAQLLFAGNSPELATALQFTVQSALQRWLGDVIEPRDVVVAPDGSAITVTVQYVIRREDPTLRAATFTRGVQP